tara:strand:- start:271 stop:774 length:504 start_codon:yes stop_codon:yes gene_type:complete
VNKKIERNYLEIKSILDLNEVKPPSSDYQIVLLQKPDFQLNKFFYKNVGTEHNWVDRLVWTEKEWIEYVSNENLYTYILKYKDDLAGFFELIFHKNLNEKEIAFFGLLQEYQNKKLGAYLLSFAIKISFEDKINRVWLHTCSQDHKNALPNYISRGMKIFKKETLIV